MQSGYILVATIILSLGIAILSVALLQIVAASSQTLNNASYQAIAKEAATAGVNYANGCVESYKTTWSALTPQTDCTGTIGTTPTAVNYVTQQGTAWQSTFSVGPPTIVNGKLTAVSTGTVKQLFGGVVIRTFTATSKITVPTTAKLLPAATGQVITEIDGGGSACAIANGKLYCWGSNNHGQLGQGDLVNRANPTLVQGLLANKTVTKVSISDGTTCAIADGTPYCWGANSFHQTGNTNSFIATDVTTPNYVITPSGSSLGSKVTDISTAPTNDPLGGQTAEPHTCALQNGVIYCWGDNGYRQDSGGSCNIFFGTCNYPENIYTATPINGYDGNTSAVTSIKTQRVVAGSHASCSVGNGNQYCWGAIPPLNIFNCNAWTFDNAWLMSPYTSYNCVAAYTNPVNTSTNGYANKFIDPATLQAATDYVCSMANTDFVCWGKAPSTNFLGQYSLPGVVMSNTDVTDNANGENSGSGGYEGNFCVIAKGVAGCSEWFVADPGTNSSQTLPGSSSLYQLITTNMTSTVGNLVPTKIAAGSNIWLQDYGCVVANGQLYCWGNTTAGTLADGNMTSTKSIPTLTGLSGTVPIGTTNGSLAANGSISVGDRFSCGVANAMAFCWGKNDYGQLGNNTTVSVSQPQAVTTNLQGLAVTKVSAGTNHACAIANGQLYCWGSNASGQLGYTTGGTYQSTPGLVSLSGRVTDVSAGNNSTCAIANGQAYCWGDNTNKQLGDGTTTARPTPVKVNGHGNLSTLTDVTNISVGTKHACAVAGGDMYCWGDNTNGQLGLGTSNDGNHDPTKLTGGTANLPKTAGLTPVASAVSAGSDFTCGIFNASVSCWGDNSNGRTGLGTTSGNTLIPTALGGSPGTYYAESVSAGGSHACAILDGNSSKTNGNLFCWGSTANGRVGNNSTSPDVSTATVITGGDASGKTTTSISAGTTSTCSVSNGDILCWGAGSNGQIGNSANSDRPVPTIAPSYIEGSYSKGIIY